MKTTILSLLGVMLCTLPFQLQAQHTTAKTDTTVLINRKKIQVTDSADQVKVRVYKTDDTLYRQVYEGIFTDEKSYEKWTVTEAFGVNLPFMKKKKHPYCNTDYYIDGHFAGFSMGALYSHHDFNNFNDANGWSLSFSNEINLSVIEYSLPMFRNVVGLTTGLGMTWRNYHTAENRHLVLSDGVTTVQNAPAGVKYTYSRLRTYELNVPLYLEFQPKGNDRIYLTAGVLLGVNTFTSYKVKYKDENSRKVSEVIGKNYNVNPFSFSYVAQMGYDNFGIYAKYTPTGVFKKDKGPDLQTVSVGLMLNF